jgi:hypothetical protein
MIVPATFDMQFSQGSSRDSPTVVEIKYDVNKIVNANGLFDTII